jgi:hypothetical protein
MCLHACACHVPTAWRHGMLSRRTEYVPIELSTALPSLPAASSRPTEPAGHGKPKIS